MSCLAPTGPLTQGIQCLVTRDRTFFFLKKRCYILLPIIMLLLYTASFVITSSLN